ncbi:hypothetical protein J6590_025165 [Homalodisca vitripennis]|nr:hypothetical protein J6590_025165 [Homalodisca vitripennis]
MSKLANKSGKPIIIDTPRNTQMDMYVVTPIAFVIDKDCLEFKQPTDTASSCRDTTRLYRAMTLPADLTDWLENLVDTAM